MAKYILFTSKSQGNDRLKSAFDKNLWSNLGASRPILAAGNGGKVAVTTEESIQHMDILVLWEPEPNTKEYGDNCLKSHLKLVCDKDEIVYLALHTNSSSLHEWQKKLLEKCELKRGMKEKMYSHTESDPYNLFIDAITAAGTDTYKEEFKKLQDFFPELYETSIELLYMALPAYLGATNGSLIKDALIERVDDAFTEKHGDRRYDLRDQIKNVVQSIKNGGGDSEIAGAYKFLRDKLIEANK